MDIPASRTPLSTPFRAVEAVRTTPIQRAVFGHAKVSYVMEGRSRIETPTGFRDLSAGQVVVLGGGVWCSAWPCPSIRTWTIYTDEEFLRSLMTWMLPESDRVLPGLHPRAWDGRALVLNPGVAVLGQIEPLLRRMSIVADPEHPEVTASRMMALFAQIIELVVPTVLASHRRNAPSNSGTAVPVVERLVQRPVRAEVAEAVELLRADIARPWTTTRLASAVSLSVSQLTRLFSEHVGATPMRFLIETRSTEFARLLQETELPIGVAARRVGWSDSRVAGTWLRRRFGLTPADYRRHTRSVCSPDDAPCGLCAGPCIRLRPTG